MVVAKTELLGRMSRAIHDDQALVITPLLDDEQIGTDSIDLRLGTDFLMTRSDRLAANVPGYAQSSEFQQAVHAPLGRYLVLPGHHTVLATTLEFIKLPDDLSAMVLTKSSWARTFITIETAPWVHPGYRGCLTLELANVSETPLILHPGLLIAQLVFFSVTVPPSPMIVGSDKDDPQDAPSGVAGVPKRVLDGKYVGPIKPEAPVFDKPEKTLVEVLGISEEHVELPLAELRRTAKQKK